MRRGAGQLTWRQARRGLTACAATVFVLTGCHGSERESEEALSAEHVHEQLVAQNAEFEKTVYRVTDGVYQAVGFGLANSIMVEGDECVFIIDSMASRETATEVRAAFEEITTKPIAALIYTHNHADHVFGGLGFVPDGEIDVYAHSSTESYIDRVVSIIRPIISMRSARMFGDVLPRTGPDAMINDGIGPFLELARGEGTIGLIRPNKTFDDVLETEICGVRVHLEHAAGETNDQIFVWLPDRKALMPGDNVYRAFPNLYTIRGTLYRDLMAWVRSIDRMRELKPEHMAPSHTRPVSGAEQIQEILTAYRDAIQFVHDQTIRGMNQGLTPDELVEVVRLPPHLASHPYLQELYGTVEWSVRSVFSGYLGWFDGDTATLSPAPPDDRARGYVQLAGGPEVMAKAVGAALDAGRYAWAAELAGHLLRADPSSSGARSLKATALRELGRRSVSPNGRNYYLTQARELEGKAKIAPDLEVTDGIRAFLETIPIGRFMAAMPVFLDAQKAADVDVVAGFRFRDVEQGYALHVRRGVAEFRPEFPEDPDVSITTDSTVWREVVLGIRNPALTLVSGDVEVDGGRLDLVAFLRMFQ
ncbi:MAG: MBL fold metallo-hydrolase [Myxococcales bacterium]|nr:MAG: MBL fold metallo-hydrolase [Myxococcales bacterium]